MPKILIVEDDKDIVNNLTEYLRDEGFDVDSAGGQNEAINKMDKNKYDLLLVDISLKDGNGFAVCSAARENNDIPVIFLSASDDEYNIVTGLEIGADDYIVKPFRPRELLSRIRKALRRNGKAGAVIEHDNIRVDTVRGIVTKNGSEIFLSALEYRLLLVFLNNKGAVLSRSRLLEEIWNIAGEYVNDNTLTVYIKRLREKIEDDPQNPTFIKTVRGLGYKVGD
ncbi:DNA-binding response OmpR family regulator [Acetivibrio thermocellus AD2]|jgi:two-component system response regulator RegX3|uniref:Stage 0 sporulation protein A homolog n=1 Tax=Acetivibrio thermocellus AD2 TaxID=1138384 RepID=A0AB36THJ2_ACETH|nr:response regulator transcription factor [Acetivibrio thermocellus]CDG35230.1 two component transcriptional regulator, winged helix family [Acetivibrio thermocellus BC1]ADU74757.1 two component transcriptional regulator, winged helix family [Acetivibrio thermocellus DSM 1313]ALX08708.1 two component transcriptional regulator, winged helix family [Acetivibrio thermocellus AD2]ANV76460.1 two component transcriptional regulator, winged helix family [Acetivibrio thermocellus DSM 2360]EIC05350.1 